MKLFYVFIFLLCIAWTAGAQRIIKGTVSDQNNAPLIGVSILVQGTNKGTISDENGNYTLTVQPENKALVFSYTGFSSREIQIGSTNTIDVSLEEGIHLQEMVVTALGITRDKKEHGYAWTECRRSNYPEYSSSQYSYQQ